MIKDLLLNSYIIVIMEAERDNCELFDIEASSFNHRYYLVKHNCYIGPH